MRTAYRPLVLWLVIGTMYFVLEGLWRIPEGGWVNIAMLPIGGLCGLAVGSIKRIPAFRSMKILCQSVIGMFLTQTVEFCSGVVLNLWLGMHIWDYSGYTGNIMGQICPQYSLLWLLLMPLAIWLEDNLRWGLWHEGKPYGLAVVYRDFVLFR